MEGEKLIKENPGEGRAMAMAPEEVRDLANPWKSYMGEIEGLTEELEGLLKMGCGPFSFTDKGKRSLKQWAREDNLDYEKIRDYLERKIDEGKYRMTTHDKGGSITYKEITKEEHDVLVRWREAECFPRMPEDGGMANFSRLMETLSQRGIDFGLKHTYPIGGLRGRLRRLVGASSTRDEFSNTDFIEEWGAQYGRIAEILEVLPESATRNVRAMSLGGEVSHGYGENNDDRVELSETVMDGPRRMFNGVVLHEIGHSSASHLGEADQAALRDAHRAILANSDTLATNYVGRSHCNEQIGVDEFIAEVFMAYVSQGTRLRDHMASSPCGAEWESVYSMFREKVFSGAEYV